MAQLVSLSIDVTKITKSKIKDGKWLNVTISVNNEANEWGKNVSIYEEQTKEERDAKSNKNYLGSGRVVWSDDTLPLVVSRSDAKTTTKRAADTDELPF